MPDCHVSELVDILNQQCELYLELLKISKAKQPVLIKGNLEALNNFTLQEEKLIVQVGRLEERRNSVQQALANHFRVSETELTLSNLITRLNGETSTQELAEAGKKIKKILKEIKTINSQNNELVKQSLDYIEFNINLITGVVENANYAERPGTKQGQGRAKLFDQKV